MTQERNKAPRFPDTRWSLVGRAEAPDDAARQTALAELLAIYSPALRDFLVAARRVPEDLADDLMHDFIADKILSRKLIHHAEREKGKFRNFLLKSLNNFVTTKLKREYAERASASGLDLSEIVDAISHQNAEQFDLAWVQRVVSDTLQLMQADCTATKRSDLWEIFNVRVVEPMLHGTEPLDYGEIVIRFRIETPRQAINLLATAKRSFIRQLRLVVGRYVQGDEMIDREIADLQGIVCR